MSKPKPEELATVDEVLDLVGLADLADVPVAALSLGTAGWSSWAGPCRPSPASSWPTSRRRASTSTRRAALAAVLRRVQRERGMAVLLVEHDLRWWPRWSTGSSSSTSAPDRRRARFDEVLADPAVRKAYLGRTA